MKQVYSEYLYGEQLHAGIDRFGSWTQSFSFEYLAGTTVFATATLDADIPLNTEVRICAGESLDSLEPIPIGQAFGVPFLSTTSGPTNIFIRVELYSWGQETPVVRSLDLNLSQETTLYTSAQNVLVDGLQDTGQTFIIDPWLRTVPIEFAWFRPQKHRTALTTIAEACGGVLYQDRYGVIRLEAGGYFSRQNGGILDNIGQDRIIDARTPVTEVRNRVEIRTRPFVALAETTIWELLIDNEIEVGQTKTYQFFFTEIEAAIDVSSEVTGATVLSETFYDWGGSIRVEGTIDGIVEIIIKGKPLAVRGSRLITRTNGPSVQANGLREFSIEDNNLIQSPDIAQEIADEILGVLSAPRRDLEIDWRGDPTIELGDRVLADGLDGYILENRISYNGIYSHSSKIRRKG